jgi:hypothetical protein
MDFRACQGIYTLEKGNDSPSNRYRRGFSELFDANIFIGPMVTDLEL